MQRSKKWGQFYVNISRCTGILLGQIVRAMDPSLHGFSNPVGKDSKFITNRCMYMCRKKYYCKLPPNEKGGATITIHLKDINGVKIMCIFRVFSSLNTRRCSIQCGEYDWRFNICKNIAAALMFYFLYFQPAASYVWPEY